MQATFGDHRLLECILQVRLSQKVLKKHADGACILLEQGQDFMADGVLILQREHLPQADAVRAKVEARIQR